MVSRCGPCTMSALPAQPLSPSTALPGDGSPVQVRGALLQILRVAGALEDVFTLKEVMHYLGQYIMGRQLYDKQKQHIVHCRDDPLGQLLEVDSFSVKNPSPVYEMLKKHLMVVGESNAAENLSLGRECVESGVEDRGQMGWVGAVEGLDAGKEKPLLQPAPSQRRPRESDGDSLDGLPRSACKRPKLDVTLDEWDLSGLPWWFLGNLRSKCSRRSDCCSTDILTNQISAVEEEEEEEDTVGVSDATADGPCLPLESEGERVSVEMKEAELEGGGQGERVTSSPEEVREDDVGAGKEEEEEAEGKMLDEPDEDTQSLGDDTEISMQDAWQCTECRRYNTPLQRYCIRCWALRKNWYQDVPLLAHTLSLGSLPGCSSSFTSPDEETGDSDVGMDVPDCARTVSDPVILPSHCRPDRPLPTLGSVLAKGPLPFGLPKEAPVSWRESQGSDGTEAEVEVRTRALLEPCKLCRMRPRNGNIIHGRTAHLVTCYSCAKKLHRARAPCPSCGKIIQTVIKIFVV